MTACTGDSRAVAVFLGPSLTQDEAAALLDARYLPPAQFGDVYRLIGSGVRAIVVIDGVFHGRAPVWQREILAAMRAGLRVYGARAWGTSRRRARLARHDRTRHGVSVVRRGESMATMKSRCSTLARAAAIGADGTAGERASHAARAVSRGVVGARSRRR